MPGPRPTTRARLVPPIRRPRLRRGHLCRGRLRHQGAPPCSPSCSRGLKSSRSLSFHRPALSFHYPFTVFPCPFTVALSFHRPSFSAFHCPLAAFQPPFNRWSLPVHRLPLSFHRLALSVHRPSVPFPPRLCRPQAKAQGNRGTASDMSMLEEALQVSVLSTVLSPPFAVISTVLSTAFHWLSPPFSAFPPAVSVF